MHVIEKLLLVLALATLTNGAFAANNSGGGQGKSNSNAQSLPDADRGLDRAGERKSEQGSTQPQAPGKKKGSNTKPTNPPLPSVPGPVEPPKPRLP